jgi:hypothetical protein
LVLVAEVQGAELGVLGLECRIEGCGCEGLGLRVYGLWLRVKEEEDRREHRLAFGFYDWRLGV